MLWHVSEMLMTDFKARVPSRLNGFYLICKTLLLYICTCPYDDSLESHVEKQNLGEIPHSKVSVVENTGKGRAGLSLFSLTTTTLLCFGERSRATA